VLFCCVALLIVDARTSTPPEEQALAACLLTSATSTSANSASRGYILLRIHTGLFSGLNIRTLTTLRLRGDFNPSAPTFGLYSSLIVCGAPVATAVGVRLCVCVGRHHYWAAGPLGLGLSLYIYVPHSSMKYNNRLMWYLDVNLHMKNIKFQLNFTYEQIEEMRK
jgi:hypothetical protein